MARKKRAYSEPEEPSIAMGATGGVLHGQLLDPKAPLPGPVKRVVGQRISRRTSSEKRELYERYCDELVRCGGNPTTALAIVLNISTDEAYQRQHELHREIVDGADLDKPLSKLLKEHDLTEPLVMRVLRGHLLGDHPAASLKAADMVLNMHGARPDGEGIEDIVRAALGEA